MAVLSCDPSRRKTGGALLGDRIRMNAIGSPRVYMRSLATRGSATEVPEALADAIMTVKAAGFDLVIAETAGIGQGDSSIVDLVDVSIYVMTSEYGAASQLEKIDMLDFADLVVVNKFEKRGSEDAVQHVRKQVQRNRKAFGRRPEEMPVFGTIASKFNDDGVTALYHALLDTVAAKTGVPLRNEPAAARRQDILLEDHHHSARAGPLPERDRRDGPGLSSRDPAADAGPAARLAPRGGGPGRSRARRPQLLARLREEARTAAEALDPETRPGHGGVARGAGSL